MHLFEDQAVPERVHVRAGRAQVLELDFEGFAEEKALDTRCFGVDHRSLEDTVQDTGDAGEVGWLEDLRVFQEQEWVSREVADTTAEGDGEELGAALQNKRLGYLQHPAEDTHLVDVGEREVAQ